MSILNDCRGHGVEQQWRPRGTLGIRTVATLPAREALRASLKAISPARSGSKSVGSMADGEPKPIGFNAAST
jgi:hypothetical protein